MQFFVGVQRNAPNGYFNALELAYNVIDDPGKLITDLKLYGTDDHAYDYFIAEKTRRAMWINPVMYDCKYFSHLFFV